MRAFNAVSSTIFDVLLAPLGHGRPWFDLLLWPIMGGIVALLVYKKVSNQAGIARAKKAISVHLLEIVLFKDDPRVVLGATARSRCIGLPGAAHDPCADLEIRLGGPICTK